MGKEAKQVEGANKSEPISTNVTNPTMKNMTTSTLDPEIWRIATILARVPPEDHEYDDEIQAVYDVIMQLIEADRHHHIAQAEKRGFNQYMNLRDAIDEAWTNHKGGNTFYELAHNIRAAEIEKSMETKE